MAASRSWLPLNGPTDIDLQVSRAHFNLLGPLRTKDNTFKTPENVKPGTHTCCCTATGDVAFSAVLGPAIKRTPCISRSLGNLTTNLLRSLHLRVFTEVEVVCYRHQEETFEGVYNPLLTEIDGPLSSGGTTFCSSVQYKESQVFVLTDAGRLRHDEMHWKLCSWCHEHHERPRSGCSVLLQPSAIGQLHIITSTIPSTNTVTVPRNVTQLHKHPTHSIRTDITAVFWMTPVGQHKSPRYEQ